MGAGLVTCAVPKSLNLTLQQKINAVVMTLPLPQTRQGTFSVTAFKTLKTLFVKFSSVVIGPGISLNHSTRQFVLKVIEHCPIPLIIDADALTIISKRMDILRKNKGIKILTPHVKEMAVLTGLSREYIDKNRKQTAKDLARSSQGIVVLKGHRSVISSSSKTAINTTGNAGMATAGTGDVLTGMIAALLAQGVKPFDAVRLGVRYHGQAADRAVKKKAKFSLIATDIIDQIPYST